MEKAAVARMEAIGAIVLQKLTGPPAHSPFDV